jgi:hypothetical protein
VLETKNLAAALIFTLLISALAATSWINSAVANPDTSSFIMAMPEEYIHYTISRVNGSLWAKIDGTYPLQILAEADGETPCLPTELPMVYPTPPGTTNIYVSANHAELDWSSYPHDTHHTAIGDWKMIYSEIASVQEQFLLKIHYEHPVQRVNGSYLFLYDLNISPYLSLRSPASSAYFTIRMDVGVSNLQAFTTQTDSVWNPINYTISQGGNLQLITLEMHSEYPKPLLGDLAIMFSETEAETTEVTLWIILPLLLITALLAFIIYRKHRRPTRLQN